MTRGRESGELVTHQRNRTWPQQPERLEGSESLSVRDAVNSNEQSVKQSARSEGSAVGGKEETTKPGTSVDQD